MSEVIDLDALTPSELRDLRKRLTVLASKRDKSSGRKPGMAPDPSSKAGQIRTYLMRHYPCQKVPGGAWTEIGNMFGVSRELVRQQAVKLGMVRVNKPQAHKFCAGCGNEMGLRTKTDFCPNCRTIQIACSACGSLLTRSAAAVARNMGRTNPGPDGRKLTYTGRAFCDRKCLGAFFGREYGWGAPTRKSGLA